MKQFFFCCSFLIIFHFSYGQNLVPNPSFELYSTCPNTVAEIYKAVPWTDPTSSTPDYFNACNSWPVGVPSHSAGFQYARTGVAYVGGATYAQGALFRDYIQAPLMDSLKVGFKYCVTFYVNLNNKSMYAADAIGAFFSNNSITCTPPGCLLANTPQISNQIGNIISDTLNWIKISGNFTAIGGEQYITIGNFNDDVNTNAAIINSGAMYSSAYYYIDDISVMLCSDTTTVKVDTLCGEVFIPNAFSPDGNGENDLECVYGKCIETMEFSIYNRWGEKVFETKDPKLCWDGTYKGVLMNTAVFAYYFNATLTTGETISKKGNISLIR